MLGTKLTNAVPLLYQIRVYLNHWSGHGKEGTLCWGQSLLMPCPYWCNFAAKGNDIIMR
ncbi:hypothetical protein [Microseira wollei]|uniref:hypothetical protein n=1 Tax=Microseira wollei TaxID=467598 RepID=UPI001CFEFE20|nr:hypothetical protein [Microseira wollei]